MLSVKGRLLFPDSNRPPSPWQEPVPANVCSAHLSLDHRRNIQEHWMDLLPDVYEVLFA